jgi:hypothetical protein
MFRAVLQSQTLPKNYFIQQYWLFEQAVLLFAKTAARHQNFQIILLKFRRAWISEMSDFSLDISTRFNVSGKTMLIMDIYLLHYLKKICITVCKFTGPQGRIITTFKYVWFSNLQQLK